MTRKRKVRVATSAGTVSTYGTWWDGGSKNEYSLIDLATGANSHIAVATNPLRDSSSTIITLSPGKVCVKTGYFCGKPATMEVICLEDDLCNVLGIYHELFGAPLGVVADWLNDQRRSDDEAVLRMFAAKMQAAS